MHTRMSFFCTFLTMAFALTAHSQNQNRFVERLDSFVVMEDGCYRNVYVLNYDSLNHVTSRMMNRYDMKGAVMTSIVDYYEYDEQGRLSRMKQSIDDEKLNTATVIIRNAQGNVTEQYDECLPKNEEDARYLRLHRYVITYDSKGNKTSQTDYLRQGNGDWKAERRNEMAYTSKGKMKWTKILLPIGPKMWEGDQIVEKPIKWREIYRCPCNKDGNLLSVYRHQNNDTTFYEYDKKGQLTVKTNNLYGKPLTREEYSYDQHGNLVNSQLIFYASQPYEMTQTTTFSIMYDIFRPATQIAGLEFITSEAFNYIYGEADMRKLKYKPIQVTTMLQLLEDEDVETVDMGSGTTFYYSPINQ